MKKILLLLLLFTGIVNGQIVNIPDANFKNKLVNTLCIDTNNDGYGDVDADVNDDGEIQISEAEIVLNLDLSFPNFTPISEQISNLTGINSFINLEIFESRNNNIGNLDLSNLLNLKLINCSFSNIYALNITGLMNLESLFCDYNQISTLNLSGQSNLKSLSCYNNLLSALDLTGLTNLLGLECGKNQIASLNLNNTPNLVGLACSDNLLNTLNVNFLTSLSQLEFGNPGLNNVAINNLTNLQSLFIAGGIQNTIDLNPLVALQSLRLTNTNLIQIDASNLQYLNRLYAYGNFSLNYINMKNGNNFDQTSGGNGVFFQTNPNLNFICADENNIQFINAHLLTQNNTTTQVNSYCNFIPGGQFNTITGNIKYDANNNGCDASDISQPNIKVNINDGTTQGSTFTNNLGNYSFFSTVPNLFLEPNVENPTYFNFTPPNIAINFLNGSLGQTFTQDFCITANGIHNDLEIVIAPITTARPGFDAVYKITYKNKGNVTPGFNSGVRFDYNPNQMSYVSSSQAVDSQGVNFINFDYSNLLPFESRSITVTFHINSPTATNPVNIGDVLNLHANVGLNIGDENPDDNEFYYNQIIVGSFDPNEITCLEGDTVSSAEIGNYLHYMINFENTGNFPAENIVVKDIIDETIFDVNSLQILNSSDAVTARISGNIAEFIFKNIQLGSGGHGNILIKIKTMPTLLTGAIASKRADIFFDYNAPVDTGMAITTFQTLSNTVFEADNSINIYPNPTTSKINITANSDLKSIELFDVQGRVLETLLGNNKNLDISNQSKGVYFLKITTQKGSKIEKVVKE